MSERYPFPKGPYPGGGETIVIELKKAGNKMSYRGPFLPGYKLIHTISNCDYDWAELRIYKKESDGRLFYAQDSGCSCNSFEDDIIESDLIELQSFAGAQRAIKEFLDSRASYFEYDKPTDLYVDAVEKLRALGLR